MGRSGQIGGTMVKDLEQEIRNLQKELAEIKNWICEQEP